MFLMIFHFCIFCHFLIFCIFPCLGSCAGVIINLLIDLFCSSWWSYSFCDFLAKIFLLLSYLYYYILSIIILLLSYLYYYILSIIILVLLFYYMIGLYWANSIASWEARWWKVCARPKTSQRSGTWSEADMFRSAVFGHLPSCLLSGLPD